ncbi:hypothetical protein A2U01_0104111, partial [Trifolium medium]|nr:hypothetical protein [Trifolium medium]
MNRFAAPPSVAATPVMFTAL